MGKFITTLFAEAIISKIDSTYNICGASIPESFKNGWFDSLRLSYECSLKDCRLNADGLWITNKLTSTDGRGNDINYNRFFWRIEPNYCAYGKPMFDAEKIYKLFKASETKKVLVETGKGSVCLEWFEFLYPTKTCWGLRQGPVHITVYEDGNRVWTSKKEVYKTGWKKEFIEFIEKRYEWKKEQ